MNKAKLTALCAKARGWNLWTDSSGAIPDIYQDRKGTPQYVVTDYNPIDDAEQADALLEYVADGRGWESGYDPLSKQYWCRSRTSFQITYHAQTQNLAKVLCSLRASPEVTDAEIEEALK